MEGEAGDVPVLAHRGRRWLLVILLNGIGVGLGEGVPYLGPEWFWLVTFAVPVPFFSAWILRSVTVLMVSFILMAFCHAMSLAALLWSF